MRVFLIALLAATAAFFVPAASADIFCVQGVVCKGTEGNDVIWGTVAADTIYGYGGQDEIHGKSSKDVIYGGKGDDVLYADAGMWDILSGGYGDDHLDGQQGNLACNPRDFDGGTGTGDSAWYWLGIGNTFSGVEYPHGFNGC